MARFATHRSVSVLARLRRAKGFWRADKGAAALEFALVATPFFALLFGVIELGLVLMAQVDLENATAAATREIRTGITQAGTTPALQKAEGINFANEICKNMLWMVSDCQTNIQVDVRTYSSFSAVNMTTATAARQSLVTNGTQFQTGGPGAIVVVQAYYAWPLFIPGMSTALKRVGDRTLLTSVTSFENEPFTANPPTS
jgi:Flp pilus assembly protein TadG